MLFVFKINLNNINLNNKYKIDKNITNPTEKNNVKKTAVNKKRHKCLNIGLLYGEGNCPIHTITSSSCSSRFIQRKFPFNILIMKSLPSQVFLNDFDSPIFCTNTEIDV